MALYIKRPRLYAERIGRGMPSGGSVYFLILGNVRKCPPVSCLCGVFFSKRGFNDTEIFINKAFKFNIIFSFSSVILN